ncbi:hypothetical protein PTTG_28432 [Puccinia triticina 1-1 BBBD Race 1]|uniref:Uncharacterized protein n=2 Tax=Puccinia triticina TaxID=208348 RepID=A0A180GBT2_PUCT1|nr:uncharacterized protein PtA15_7A477 [Puccinia triticina]OAV90145.1 hypothetical protein PTTG_28432 [Puccinia triticina 1-1 BBBD Race 1]WAQ86749.1 hypothetical protein PtA15_7A477 [Puccinia triticina]WAR56618.1 hypothetical protein PtB15_7B467 [Puccinia triticina]
MVQFLVWGADFFNSDTDQPAVVQPPPAEYIRLKRQRKTDGTYNKMCAAPAGTGVLGPLIEEAMGQAAFDTAKAI